MGSPAAASVQVDLRLYTVEALHAAAYRFADLGCTIGHVDWVKMTATVDFAVPLTDNEHDALLIRFKQELTDQVLRQRIRSETEAIRTLILAHAFADSAIAES